MRHRIALAATAALLALAGCSNTDDRVTGAGSAPATSASATSATPTHASTPSVGEEGTLSLAEACPAVVADVKAALGTLAEYVKNPLNGSVTVTELEQVRAELHVDEMSAPEELRGPLNSQVGVLNDAIEDLQTGTVTKIDIAKFQAAGQQALGVCNDAVR
jgi:hypothetical protein